MCCIIYGCCITKYLVCVCVGESFSIADPNETWVMELIGKGEFERGAVWVARRVPDGYVCGKLLYHSTSISTYWFPPYKSTILYYYI